ncbi:hypothetical protein ABPG73_013204 [Tetrahymena malaccensis]
MRLLLIGVSPNCSEIVKNLVKNGINTIYLYDDTIVEMKDLRCIYFYNESDIGTRKDKALQKYNPSITVLDKQDIDILNLKYLKIDSIVVTKMLSYNLLQKYNNIAISISIPFILSCALGLSFFIFSCFPCISNEDMIKKQTGHVCIDQYFTKQVSDDVIENIFSYNQNHQESYALLYAIFEYNKQFKDMPRLFNDGDSLKFSEILNEIGNNFEIDFSQNESLYLNFSKTLLLEIPIVAEISGALTACEIFKTVINRFSPVNQILFWDDFSLLQKLKIPSKEISPNMEFFNYKGLLGDKMMDEISNLKILLVGCGAVGCEQIKNLYQLGACRGEKGHLYIADDDLIERSNLPRQVLFNEEDVKTHKSYACQKWLQNKDKSIKVTSFTHLVNKKNEDIFNYEFFQSLDMIIVAVDSIEARHYLADKAILHSKFLIESGTQGFEAQSQSQIPYFSTKIEIALPQESNESPCTIKSALKTIGDALNYAKTIFTQEFSSLRQSDGCTFLSNESLKQFRDQYLERYVSIEFCDKMLWKSLIDIFNEIFYKDVLSIGKEFKPFRFNPTNSDHNELLTSLFNILKHSIISSLNDFSEKENINQNISKILPHFDKDNIDHTNVVYQISKLRAQAFNIPYNLEKSDAICKISNITPAIIQSTSIASGFALIELFPWLYHRERIFKMSQDISLRNQQKRIEYNTALLRIDSKSECNNEIYEEQKDQIYGKQQQPIRKDLFLCNQAINEIQEEFDNFGFTETSGNTAYPISLGRSQIQFELGFLNVFKLSVEQNAQFLDIIQQINSILLQNFISSPYIIEFQSETIYRQDASTTPLIRSLARKQLQSYLEKKFIGVVECVNPKATKDKSFRLSVFTSKLITHLQKGDKISEIDLTLK